MQIALVPVAPFVLLGFAAVTVRSARPGGAVRKRLAAPAIAIGGGSPMFAVCRIDVDSDDADAGLDAAIEPITARDRRAARERPSGVAVIRLDITPTGDIRDVDVIVPSGFRALDEAAVKLVRLARVGATQAGRYRATIVFTE